METDLSRVQRQRSLHLRRQEATAAVSVRLHLLLARLSRRGDSHRNRLIEIPSRRPTVLFHRDVTQRQQHAMPVSEFRNEDRTGRVSVQLAACALHGRACPEESLVRLHVPRTDMSALD